MMPETKRTYSSRLASKTAKPAGRGEFARRETEQKETRVFEMLTANGSQPAPGLASRLTRSSRWENEVRGRQPPSVAPPPPPSPRPGVALIFPFTEFADQGQPLPALTSDLVFSAPRKSSRCPRRYLSTPRQGLGCLSLVPGESIRCPSTEGPAQRAGSTAEAARAAGAWSGARQAQGWGSSRLRRARGPRGGLGLSAPPGARRDAESLLRRRSRPRVFGILRGGATLAGSGIGALFFALSLARLGGLKMEETLQDSLEPPPPPPTFSAPLLGASSGTFASCLWGKTFSGVSYGRYGTPSGFRWSRHEHEIPGGVGGQAVRAEDRVHFVPQLKSSHLQEVIPVPVCGGARRGLPRGSSSFWVFAGRDAEPRSVCEGCRGIISERVLLRLNGRLWHERCVRCASCREPLESSCFYREQKLYCRLDYEK
ncbi:LIM homeobox transcription factor 1-alpha [Crotalus adamanteus]|uniref:LIM homeobox transcription factor 1-alpha n=1 Tax=Crotalus adamanteus TaxID=8729 RepID=A0AAW1BNX0_CROAD